MVWGGNKGKVSISTPLISASMAVIWGGIAPGSRLGAGAGSGVGAFGGAAFSLFVSWEDPVGELTAGSLSVASPASAGSEVEEGGRGARKRGSGAGGG